MPPQGCSAWAGVTTRPAGPTLGVVLSASASIGHSLTVFFDAVGKFFSDLAAVHWGALLLGLLFFAFTQGVFPKPPEFAKLSSFDISYLAEHFRFTLFLITALGVLGLFAFAMLSARFKAFWVRVRQGVTILSDRPRYLREVASL